MATKFRKSPPVCLGISIVNVILGRIRFSNQYLGDTISMEDDQEYAIFRHIKCHPEKKDGTPVTFIVSFKFSRLTHRANKIASIIPMLLISGYPGFGAKMYGVNRANGYWQGMYQWESEKALEEYKKSFVFRMMNKRAIESTINSFELNNQKLDTFIRNHIS